NRSRSKSRSTYRSTPSLIRATCHGEHNSFWRDSLDCFRVRLFERAKVGIFFRNNRSRPLHLGELLSYASVHELWSGISPDLTDLFLQLSFLNRTSGIRGSY